MKKLKIDQEKCIGCGLCASIAQETFRLNQEGKAEVTSQSGNEEAKIREAIDSCPVTAISWEE